MCPTYAISRQEELGDGVKYKYVVTTYPCSIPLEVSLELWYSVFMKSVKLPNDIDSLKKLIIQLFE